MSGLPFDKSHYDRKSGARSSGIIRTCNRTHRLRAGFFIRTARVYEHAGESILRNGVFNVTIPGKQSTRKMPDQSQEAAPAPFSIPQFRRMWFANVTSQFGSLIQGVAAAWTMVELGGSRTQVALVSASVTLPIVFFALLAGALADNYPRRTVMLCAQISMLFLSVILVILAWMNLLSPWLLLAFTFLIGCGNALNAPSWQATVGDIVPRGTIASAVAMNSMGFNMARSAGPALGGAIVAAVGSAAAFTVNAFSYFGIIFVLLRWRPTPPDKNRLKEGLGTAMAAGVRYVLMSPPVRVTMLRGVLFGVAASSVPALMPLVAKDLIGGGAATFGLLSGGFGVGAVLGALSSRHIRQRLNTEQTIRLSVSALIIGMVIISQSNLIILTVLGLLLAGAGWLMSVATMNVVVQMSVPRWVVGRALSIFQISIFGSMAAGSWMSGQFSEHFGTGRALLIMAAIQCIGLVAGLVIRLPEVGDTNLDPVGRWKVPDVKVGIDPRSGPVHISVHYQIEPEDAADFIRHMNERRRVRLRDGARSWTLARDLSDPELWTEQYRFGRWRDYILHNERQTHEDAASMAAIRTLHKGSWPPVITRLLERQVASAATAADLTSSATVIDTTPGS